MATRSGRAEAARGVDYFLNLGGDGFAVLGGGSDFEQALRAARHVAESIEPSS